MSTQEDGANTLEPLTWTMERKISSHGNIDCPYGIPTCCGCTQESDSAHHGEISESRRMLESIRPESAAGSPVILLSPAVFRSQLKEEFMTIYWPLSSMDTDFMYSKFIGDEHLQSRGPSMTAAIDTLCLLHLGSYRKDPALLHVASNRRRVVLANLKNDLAREGAIYSDDVLGAVWLLSICDAFASISKLPQTSGAHRDAVQQILLSRKADAPLSRLGQLVLYNSRSASFSFGMARRKPVALSGPGWAQRAAMSSPHVGELTELMLRIPKLLQRFDGCSKKHEDNLEEQNTLLDAFTNIECRLVAWFSRWMRTLPGEAYHYVSTSSFPHFRSILQELPEIFTRAIQFPSFALASLQITYWTGLLQVKQTILLLVKLIGYDTLMRLRHNVLLDELDEYAAQLCHSVVFCSSPQYGYCGALRCFAPIFFAAKWYVDRRDYDKLRWCEIFMARLEDSHQLTSPYGAPWEALDDQRGS